MKFVIQIETRLGMRGGAINKYTRTTEVNWDRLKQTGTWILLGEIQVSWNCMAFQSVSFLDYCQQISIFKLNLREKVSAKGK